MAGMRELLEEMVSKGASDLHLTAGLPPQFRVDGLVASSDFPVLTGEETTRLAYSILNEEQKKRFENEKELDSRFGVQGISRFRANVFQQRGVTSHGHPPDPLRDPHLRGAGAAAGRSPS